MQMGSRRVLRECSVPKMHAREIMRLRIKAQLLHEEILAYCCASELRPHFFFHASDCLEHNEMEYLCIEMNASKDVLYLPLTHRGWRDCTAVQP